MYKNKKGITLIALVITIIVLLILAGIAISMLSGENGIINKAVKARNGMDEAKAIECIKLSMTAERTNTTDVSDEDLKSELDKYFDNAEVTQTSSNNYVIEIDGKVYKINNGQVTTGYEKETITDGVIANANEGETIDYKIYGNSVQDGDPAPDNPVEIQSVGDLITEGEYKDKYKIPITVSGKNLFNIERIFKDISTYENGCYKFDAGRSWSLYHNGINSLKFKENTQYTLKIKGYVEYKNANEPSNWRIVFVYDDGTTSYKLLNYTTETEITYTSKSGATVDKVAIEYGYNGTVYISQIQLEEGATATEYEPYQEPKTTNIYLNEPLRKVGDYADYIDFKNKKVVRKIVKQQLSSDWTWKDYGTDGAHANNLTYVGVDKTTVLSEYGKSTKISYNFSNDNLNRIAINYNWFGITNVTELKEKLATLEANGKPFTVYHPISTPAEETIELSEILTHKGTNIITVDTNTKPSKTEITNYKSTK